MLKVDNLGKEGILLHLQTNCNSTWKKQNVTKRPAPDRNTAETYQWVPHCKRFCRWHERTNVQRPFHFVEEKNKNTSQHLDVFLADTICRHSRFATQFGKNYFCWYSQTLGLIQKSFTLLVTWGVAEHYGFTHLSGLCQTEFPVPIPFANGEECLAVQDIFFSGCDWWTGTQFEI